MATLTIIMKPEWCTAQLFPWSNLKQYFDHKTRNGPGNGGVLNVEPDQRERPYRHTDSETSVLKNNPINVPDDTTLKDITKHIQGYTKNGGDSSKRVNFNYATFFENYPPNDEALSPIVTVHHDSTVRPQRYKPIQNIDVQLSDDPNVLTNQPVASATESTIVITQKPFVVGSNPRNRPYLNKNRISHKTVSILPSSGTTNENAPTIIQYNHNEADQIHPVLYVTSRPTITQVYPIQPQATSTHKPPRPIVVNPYQDTTKYHNLNPIFLPTAPPSVDSGPRIIKLPEASQSDNKYLYTNNKESVATKTLPSLKTLKPFRIGNTGLVDYLVPPPMPAQAVSSEQASSFGTKRRQRKPTPHPTKEQSEVANKRKTKEQNDIKLLKEMSRLKPPDSDRSRSTAKKSTTATSKRSNKKLSASLKEPQRPQVKSRILVKNVAYHNHKMPSYNSDDDKDVQHDSAPSYINEQVISETGHGGSSLNDGQRVEFQMHGQNGPKSYKFGFDTGKGHNRQFRYEERDTNGHVKGHYGYYDKEGKLQMVNYEADPHHGFKAEPAV